MTGHGIDPPRWAELLLERFVPGGVAGRSILGDAREEYAEHLRSGPRVLAALWYWKHVLSIIVRFVGSSSPGYPVGRHGPSSGWGVRVGNLLNDLRIAARLLLRKPGFTLAAVATLGLGVGANTAMFSLVDGVLLKPLPYPEAEQLVGVYRIDPDLTGRNPTPERLDNFFAVPYEVFRDWADMSSAFEDAGAYFLTAFTLTGGDRPERVTAVGATAGVFAALGIRPMLGRAFLAEDDEVGSPALAVLSHGLWQRRYGSDPSVLGSQISLSGTSYEVVGVMPPQFSFPFEGMGVWVTLDDERKMSPVRNAGYLQVIARLKDGVSLEQAQRDVDAVALRIGELHPDESEHGIGLFPRKSLEVADIQAGLVLLLGAVGLVLLIACANIANLLLVRATERRRELGVRLALGAERGRLLAQHLSESLVLALVGGTAGCVLAVASLGPMKAAFPGGLPRADSIAVDYRMLLFAAGLVVLTGLLTGIMPGIRAIRTPLADVLLEGSRGATGGGRRNRIQASLVVSEIALAFVLLVGAGLFIRSLARLTSVERGFDTKDLLTMGVSLPARYRESDEALLSFFTEFTDLLRAIPGVRAVGSAGQMPFVGGWSTPPAVFETSDGLVEGNVHSAVMTPEYLSTMGVPVIAGRGFTVADGQGSMLVAVVNQAMARQFWADENPLGRRIRTTDAAGDSVWITVAGVVGDIRYRLSMDPFPAYYLPLAQWPDWFQWVIVRTAIEPNSITPAVREVMAGLDPDVPVEVLQLEDEIRDSFAVAGPRFGIFVLGCLSGLAALLAVVGVYGVLAYTVQQRANEIGIRMALGAGSSDVVHSVLGRGLVMVGVGLLLGLGIAISASRVVRSLLFEVSPTDPGTLVGVALLISGAAVVASYVPARRATKVDPVEALRRE